MTITLILTTLPDDESAQNLTSAVLSARLAACVTRLGASRSSYHWQGKIETADEIPLLFKTSAVRALELERFILAQHPYSTPELLQWSALASDAYGRWVLAETQPLLHV
ncbi:divalent-cation tolerance protein CutA [Paraburkholderia hayleyella]|uniref:divalent-cation tolerance protein CutA n=1 Tax=Paraburkholderia hayleyella TaxID=2152889 RepID=UPI001290E514|nr:divalent-cation tolerance protein CutA [Paraburkholderia hayleyella]